MRALFRLSLLVKARSSGRPVPGSLSSQSFPHAVMLKANANAATVLPVDFMMFIFYMLLVCMYMIMCGCLEPNLYTEGIGTQLWRFETSRSAYRNFGVYV